MRLIGLLMTLALLIAGCSSGKVISAAEMDKATRLQETPVVSSPVVPEWTGSWADLGIETELVSPFKAKIRGTEIVVSIVTTGWSSFETPKGESRQGWAELQFIQDGDVKRVRIEEGDYGFAHGYRIDVSYAFELWNEERSLYDPHVKYTITKQSP